ncbi:hypothetical protein QTJ16_002427 [Diplocarpon rosae]|uniref:Formamidopyrimidine-DNA glycosylase catalytic domain-containing protein n=1 Tax=Diplocarpon rosae TaxID=946125 RepID=A0AAD9WFZ1_9HELO|nr:hypothetical protein QTJ16_002427 [Diplocarpon rosae]
MPEIAEVARIVYFLKKSLVGKTLSLVKAQDDANVFGKVGTSAAEFQKSLTGKKVLNAGQQGKYFWLIMSSPPHPVFHFGMTGWFYIKGEPSHHRPKQTDGEEIWPPRFWKFALETDSKPKVEAAFADARRFARIRLVDCAAEDIRKTTPLKENGPDPVIDKEILTADWLVEKMKKRHVPVKAFMLDQANISGIGNWVGDEIMYHAKLHPEQYTDTFSESEIKHLHASIRYVCQTAVDHLADSSKFPEEWLFKHRWGKGKKDAATTLPNGQKITFLTVGGRTSCVVPSVQKKTGAVAGDVKKGSGILEDGAAKKAGKGDATSTKRTSALRDEDEDDMVDMQPSPPTRRKRKATVKEVDDNSEEAVTPPKKRRVTRKTAVKAEVKVEDEQSVLPTKSKGKGKGKEGAKKAATENEGSDSPLISKKGSKKIKTEEQSQEGRRRSGRATKKV